MTEASEATRRTPGTPCWASLMVHGLGTTEEFYADLFGWEYEPGPEQLGPYVRAVLDGREVAGIGEMPPDRQLPVAWTTYLATDDADATAESIRSCGGTVAVGPLDAGVAGRVAICSDPLGAIFGLWQAASHLGTGLAGGRAPRSGTSWSLRTPPRSGSSTSTSSATRRGHTPRPATTSTTSRCCWRAGRWPPCTGSAGPCPTTGGRTG